VYGGVASKAGKVVEDVYANRACVASPARKEYLAPLLLSPMHLPRSWWCIRET
jgi:hypothetical protein